MSTSQSVMVPVRSDTRERLRDLKEQRKITYDCLLAEFLTLYGSPISSDHLVQMPSLRMEK